MNIYLGLNRATTAYIFSLSLTKRTFPLISYNLSQIMMFFPGNFPGNYEEISDPKNKLLNASFSFIEV